MSAIVALNLYYYEKRWFMKRWQKSSTYHPPSPGWHVIAKLPFNGPLCKFPSHHCAPSSHRMQPGWKIRHLIKGHQWRHAVPHEGRSFTTLHYGKEKKISNSLTRDLNLTVVITRAMTLQPSPSPSYSNLLPSLPPPSLLLSPSFTLVLQSAGSYS